MENHEDYDVIVMFSLQNKYHPPLDIEIRQYF